MMYFNNCLKCYDGAVNGCTYLLLNCSVKLKHFEKFQDTTEALAATTAAVEGKVSKMLKKMLKKVSEKKRICGTKCFLYFSFEM